MKTNPNTTIEERIKEIADEILNLNARLYEIHLDLDYTNLESQEYQGLLKEHLRLTKQLWAIKANW